MGNILRAIMSLLFKEQRMKPHQLRFQRRAFRAVRKGDVQALREMMEEPVSAGGKPLCNIINHVTGRSLLHAAMEYGHRDCIKFLVGLGCQMTLEDNSKESPLHAACMNDSEEGLLTALEIDKSLDLEIRDMWHRTLFLKAVVYNSPRVVRLLLQRGVNLNAQDIHGMSALHIAVSYKRMDLVQELAAKGACLNLMNDKGRTPLSFAITACNFDMVKELLMLGASTCSRRGTTLPTVTAISELVRHSEGGVLCDQSAEILHLMLAAHGHLLHSDEPNVFGRVLHGSGVMKDHLPLLLKMHFCSDILNNDFPLRSSTQQLAGNSGPQTHTAMSLSDLAKRSARSALMASGCNVIWAVQRLNSSVPPAVKSMLLLKDYDKELQMIKPMIKF